MTPRETSTATVAAIAGAVLILVVAVLVLVVAERPGDRVLAGVSVEDRDVGGVGYADLQATVGDLARNAAASRSSSRVSATGSDPPVVRSGCGSTPMPRWRRRGRRAGRGRWVASSISCGHGSAAPST